MEWNASLLFPYVILALRPQMFPLCGRRELKKNNQTAFGDEAVSQFISSRQTGANCGLFSSSLGLITNKVDKEVTFLIFNMTAASRIAKFYLSLTFSKVPEGTIEEQTRC